MIKPIAADVWRYPYLWHRQHGDGETEGRKTRPVAFVAVLPGKAGGTNLFILAITSAQPGRDRVAVGVPEIERHRAGLDPIPLWVMVDEYNHDILESSAYFEPGARLGAFSPSFHKKVMSAFIAAVRTGQSKAIPRAD
ncbi:MULTISPECIES: hypothetical protein [unclassified Mesorhizobium]|uniref:hypothetical protein n=1 Tax=unclassified Mesorhizobium TaxID=325217 RepID=UPI001CC950CB|nr:MULTISPECIES: hypothetical protein [unclassified Mesorhizobium]MBZ9742851.1 hypothetical protein [Mesorhizobium sp. CO1-1-4]MBZ9805951.1 hypothetical protein [Mesorhizobium sp. ES1-6]